MALKGDLASVDLAQVFQMLALNQKVGLLSIVGPRSWRALYFDLRGVTLYYNEHTLVDKVLAHMVRAGRLVDDNVREAQDHAAQSGQRVVETLLAGGYVTEAELEELMRTEMEEEIYDLFFWREAKFEFFEGATTFEGREGVIDERFFFSTDSLIMEAARRIDEWSFIQERIPGPLEVFRVVQGANVMDQDDAAVSLVQLADGKRNVARLIEVTGLSAFHVYKHLAVMLDQGLIEAVPGEELIASAKDCVSEGRLQDAINLFEKAIALGVGIPESHALVARAYESIQEYELAGWHWKCVAEYHASQNSAKEALPILRHVVQMLPTDLAARERLVELGLAAAGKSEGFDPMAEGKALVDLYLEIGELERVRGILERLLREHPADIELKKSLIHVHTKAGDTARVIELYESMARDEIAAKRPIEAVKYLQKILLLDRSRKDVSDWIKRLYEMDERSRSRRRSLVAIGVLIVALAGLGVVWWFYEQQAREQFARLEVTAQLQAKDFAGAVVVYENFLESHPFTTVAKEARAKLAEIEALQKLHEAEMEKARIARNTELRKIRDRYQRSWEEYQQHFKAGRLDDSLQALESARALVQQANEEEDRRWSGRVQLDKSLKELQLYLAEAVHLDRQGRELIDAGRWREARKPLLDLVKSYEMTVTARKVLVPVQVSSRPKGAVIHRNGKPLTLTTANGEVPVTTPAVVLLSPFAKEALELRREGFLPLPVQIDARTMEVSDHLLTVVPERTIAFAHPSLTAPGAARDYVTAGLRGGHFGLFRLDLNRVEYVVKMPGLSEVVGQPLVYSDRVYLRTNENSIQCRALQDGAIRWNASFEHTLGGELVLRDGRALAVDDQGRIYCLDPIDGTVRWMLPIGGTLAGPPTLEGRTVRVATVGGEMVVLDAADGRELRRVRIARGLTSSPVLVRDGVIFCTSEGQLLRWDEIQGRPAWTVQLGRSVISEEIQVAEDLVYVVTGDAKLLCLDAIRGTQVARTQLQGRRTSGPLAVGNTLFLVLREELGKDGARDCLQALDPRTLEALWEYRDGKVFAGPLGTDGHTVFLTNGEGRILRLR